MGSGGYLRPADAAAHSIGKDGSERMAGLPHPHHEGATCMSADRLTMPLGEAMFIIELAPGEPFLKKPFTIDELQSAVTAALVYRPPATWRRGRPQR